MFASDLRAQCCDRVRGFGSSARLGDPSCILHRTNSTRNRLARIERRVRRAPLGQGSLPVKIDRAANSSLGLVAVVYDRRPSADRLTLI
jgi:hypothetical protein